MTTEMRSLAIELLLSLQLHALAQTSAAPVRSVEVVLLGTGYPRPFPGSSWTFHRGNRQRHLFRRRRRSRCCSAAKRASTAIARNRGSVTYAFAFRSHGRSARSVRYKLGDGTQTSASTLRTTRNARNGRWPVKILCG